MRLNILLSALLFTVLISSCTEGEDYFEFETSYKNESGSFLTIAGFNRDNQLEYQYLLENNMKSPICKEQSTLILGPWCGADSLVISFENEKGYICVPGSDSQPNLCFLGGKSPFGIDGNETYYREISENSFEFIITQEDFENALDLPE